MRTPLFPAAKKGDRISHNADAGSRSCDTVIAAILGQSLAQSGTTRATLSITELLPKEAVAGSFNAGQAPALAQNPLAGGTVVTRAGGLTPSVLADAVNAADAPALLQSPGEGQLLVVRTQKAAALSTEELTHAFVDGQMDGLSAPDAYAAALQSKGYLVYERPWDGWLVSFLKKAVL